MHAQHEADARDDPTITKEAGAPGGNGNHEAMMQPDNGAGNGLLGDR
jgi:hypothetical protein